MKKSMKHSKQQKNILESLFDIAWINNLESSNFIDSIKMIKQKGYEKELVHEVEMSCDILIEMLESDITFNNTCQTIYEYIVNEELKEFE